MDEYITRFKNKKRKTLKIKLKPRKKVSMFISKCLLSIILFLTFIIYSKNNEENILMIKNYVFSESLPFTKIKNWYENIFGEVLPSEENEKMVFGDTLVYKKIEDYYDGEKLTVSNNALVSTLNGGIVVFIGDKENYGKTVIIQGNDGVDIWYGNINNPTVKLYDYIEKGTTIGQTLNDELFLCIKQDDKYLKYEEYKN